LKSVHRFPGGFRKVICSSHAAFRTAVKTAARGFKKSAKILNHFARGEIKLVNEI
jgi:hypothetical protein